MRKSSAIQFLLGLAAILQAFPFQIGRSMEYSVLRRGGAESAIVTILPMDTTGDPAGTNWRIQVKDSLVAGARTKSTPLLKIDTLVFQGGNSDGKWVKNNCVLPWEILPDGTELDFAGFFSRGISLACALGLASTSNVSVDEFPFRSYRGTRIESNPMFSSAWKNSYPQLEGKWDPDTGWVAMQDGVSQEAWALIRIGNGPALDLATRFQSPRWMVVRPGDLWVWKKTKSWTKTLARDTIQGVEVDTVRWKAVRRLGDSGVRGRWRFERTNSGDRSVDTSVVDFDSPFTQAEQESPQDLDWTVFRRGGAPSWYPPASTDGSSGNGYAAYGWVHESTTMYSGVHDTTTRTYWFMGGFGLSRMEHLRKTRIHGPETGNPTTDTSIVIELLSLNGTSGTKPISIASRSIGTIASRAGLDRFLASGGRIVSIRDPSGRGIQAGDPDLARVLRSRRGLVFIEAIAPSGERFAVRLALP